MSDRRTYNAAYHAANRDAILAHKKVYAAAHRKERAVAMAKWNAANREHRTAYNAAYYAAHREEILAQKSGQWYGNHLRNLVQDRLTRLDRRIKRDEEEQRESQII